MKIVPINKIMVDGKPRYLTGKRIKLYDAEGTYIPFCMSYDTETEIAEICEFNQETKSFKMTAEKISIVFKHLPNSYIIIGK